MPIHPKLRRAIRHLGMREEEEEQEGEEEEERSVCGGSMHARTAGFSAVTRATLQGSGVRLRGPVQLPKRLIVAPLRCIATFSVK